MRRFHSFALAAVAAGLFAGAASAEQGPQCARHDKMVQLLAKKYRETPVSIGTVNQNRLMQFFASERGTWTILMTKTSGESCILAAGSNFEKLREDFRKLDPAA